MKTIKIFICGIVFSLSTSAFCAWIQIGEMTINTSYIKKFWSVSHRGCFGKTHQTVIAFTDGEKLTVDLEYNTVHDKITTAESPKFRE